MKKMIFPLLMLFSLSSVMSQSHYKTDPAHTSINFKVKHMGITFVTGKFDKFDGGVIGDITNLEDTRVFFNVDVTSINTGVPARDDHLRSDDFFDTEKFTSMTFESSKIEKISEEEYVLHGKLQIKDITKDVKFDVKYGGKATGQDGSEVLGFTAEKTINRLDYNINYDVDGVMIGKEVIITLFLEFKKAS